MKKIIILTLVAIFTTVSLTYAQEVTKFLGIPIDGTKSEMINKLKEKGFIYSNTDDLLRGQFNGEDVKLNIDENKNIVYQIVVYYKQTIDEKVIIWTFNDLYERFKNNLNYKLHIGNEITEDIKYKILTNGESYGVGFYQTFENKPIADKNKEVMILLSSISNEYYIAICYKNHFNEPNGEDL